MNRDDAGKWLYLAGRAMGETERYWFGSLHDLGQDMRHVLRTGGPKALRSMAQCFAGRSSGPRMRILCRFARAIARAVEDSETSFPRPYGPA